MTYQDTFWKMIKVNLTKRPNITLEKLVYRSKSSPTLFSKNTDYQVRLSKGSTIVNSVYSPALLFTLILPSCPLTTVS
ncbi:MAG: hypothetical protein JWQ84_1473 [Mucilaginibacter sp.]|nr:hypothetical protein [Mucilaginibacter sp.]MDB5016641.1 hypothetical protein [Mucilaginibacter sp.]